MKKSFFLPKTHFFLIFFKLEKKNSNFLFDNIFDNIHCILNTSRYPKNIAKTYSDLSVRTLKSSNSVSSFISNLEY